MFKKYLLLSGCLVSLVFIVGCNREVGTGLSENETYLSYFENDNVLGIVIAGEYYLLPEPLNHFIDNGWEMYEPDRFRSQNFSNLEAIILPPQSFIELQLVQDGIRLDLSVVNRSETDTISLLEANVMRLQVGTQRAFLGKDDAVVIGGITGNTSETDALNKLIDLELATSGQRFLRAISVRDENPDEYGILRFSFSNNLLTRFTVEVGGSQFDDLHWSHYTLYVPQESLENSIESELAFMVESYYFEGILVDIYMREDNQNEVLVVRNNDDEYFAVSFTGLPASPSGINISPGDTIRAYYGTREHDPNLGNPFFVASSRNMVNLYGEAIPFVGARVLVVNGEVFLSSFRR